MSPPVKSGIKLVELVEEFPKAATKLQILDLKLQNPDPLLSRPSTRARGWRVCRRLARLPR